MCVRPGRALSPPPGAPARPGLVRRLRPTRAAGRSGVRAAAPSPRHPPRPCGCLLLAESAAERAPPHHCFYPRHEPGRWILIGGSRPRRRAAGKSFCFARRWRSLPARGPCRSRLGLAAPPSPPAEVLGAGAPRARALWRSQRAPILRPRTPVLVWITC